MAGGPVDDSEDALDRAFEALLNQDWATLRLLLHPYLHFTGPDGVTTRGRTKVVAILTSQAKPERPTSIEMRVAAVEVRPLPRTDCSGPRSAIHTAPRWSR